MTQLIISRAIQGLGARGTLKRAGEPILALSFFWNLEFSAGSGSAFFA